jgi:hypothetical protein
MENIHINPIAQRIQDGTVFGGRDMCASCRWAIRRQSAVTGRTDTRCSSLNPARPEPIVTKIATCTAYLAKGQLSLHEMSEVAWVIETKGGKHIGFLTPEELRRRNMMDNPPPRGPMGF